MDMLYETLASENDTIIPVKECNMKDWTSYLGPFYRKMPEIDKMHISLAARKILLPGQW
jgi:hypothetical protein